MSSKNGPVQVSNVADLYQDVAQAQFNCPLFVARVAAGFPSPAEDYAEKRLELSDLIKHPVSTFFVKVSGDSMIDAGIFDGDLLIVDKAEPVRNGHICVAIVDGEFCVKQFEQASGRVRLISANPNFPPLEIAPEQDFELWGRVIYVLRKC